MPVKMNYNQKLVNGIKFVSNFNKNISFTCFIKYHSDGLYYIINNKNEYCCLKNTNNNYPENSEINDFNSFDLNIEWIKYDSNEFIEISKNNVKRLLWKLFDTNNYNYELYVLELKDDSSFVIDKNQLSKFVNKLDLNIKNDDIFVFESDKNFNKKPRQSDLMKHSLVSLSNISNTKLKATWLDNPSETNLLDYTTDEKYTQLMTNRANIEYILGRKINNQDKILIKQNDKKATIKLFTTNNNKTNDTSIIARWDNWDEIKDWERFDNDNIIVNKIYADKDKTTGKYNNTSHFCIGLNRDNKTAFCSAIGDRASSGWTVPNNIKSGFQVDINTGRDTVQDVNINAADKCFNLPYGDGYNPTLKEKGLSGILFGEGNCNDMVGNSIYDINNAYIKNYDTNKINKLDPENNNENIIKSNIENS